MADQAGNTFCTITWRIHNGNFWLKEMEGVLVSGYLPDPNDKDNHWSLSILALRSAYDDDGIRIGLSKSKPRDANLTLALQRSELFLPKNGDAETDHFKAQIKWNHDDKSDVRFVIPRQELLNNWHIYFPKNILTICCKIPAIKNRHCFIDSVLLREVFVWEIESFSRSSVSTQMVQVDSVNITIQCTRLSHRKVGIDILKSYRYAISCKIEQMNTNQECFPYEGLYDSPKELSIDTSHLGNDTLCLKCIFYDMTKEPLYSTIDSANHDEAFPQSQGTLSKSIHEGLCRFFKNQTFCDATLSTDDATFPVHKNVLCAVSPVFCATFEGHTVEGQTGHVDIPDLDPATVKRMLMFLYDGNNSLEGIHWDGACKLYYAADKYDIISLKKACLSVLKDKLSTSNACSALVLADTHQDKDFMAYVQVFVANNDEVLHTSEWKDLSENNAMFLLKMLQEIHLKTYLQHLAIPNDTNKSDIQICLQNGLLRLYNAKMHCDAALKTNTATVPVHKNVLSAVSPVFCALFEEKGDVVDIPDMDTDILELMLLSIYNRPPENLQLDESLKLYHAASVYRILPLKELCLSILKSKLSVTNAGNALVFADKWKNKDLFTCVLDFICNHVEVINTDEWRRLTKNNTKLVGKVRREIRLRTSKKQSKRTSYSEGKLRKKVCM